MRITIAKTAGKEVVRRRKTPIPLRTRSGNDDVEFDATHCDLKFGSNYDHCAIHDASPLALAFTLRHDGVDMTTPSGALVSKTGLLLVNLGSPEGPTTPEVRHYLREFLSDPRVIDIAPAGRWLLLNGAILPFRPRK